MTIHSFGMCGGCVFRVKGLTAGTPEYDAALAQAKIDFQGQGNLVRKRGETVKAKVRKRRNVEAGVTVERESGAIDAEKQLQFAPKVEGSPILTQLPRPDNSILLCFNDGDEGLLDKLKETARRHRREPDQEILWMIEMHLGGPTIYAGISDFIPAVSVAQEAE